MNKAFFLSLNKSNASEQWDSGLIWGFLNGDLWQTADWVGFDVEIVSRVSKSCERAIVIIPARHHKGLEAEINEELKKIGRVVLFLLGDEEAEFNVDLIDHPNIEIWVQNPHIGKHDKFHKLGTGYPKHLKNNVPEYQNKDNEIFFSGQVTHDRRTELVRVLLAMAESTAVELNQTKGFTQGLEPKEYYKKMAQAKIAPAPSGAVIPDSFRLFEALEMMCVPIADTKTPSGEVMPYWDWLFGEIVPFYCVDDWDRLFGLVPEINSNYYEILHEITCWWIKWKRNFVYKVMEQLNG